MGFWEPFFFWVFAFSALVASMSVILFRNPLYSALALIVDFFCFSGLYVLLSAHFIAVTQVLVYTGAIMVLFLFIIMLLNLREDELERFEFRIHYLLAIIGASGLCVMLISLLAPLVDFDKVKEGQQAAVTRFEKDTATHLEAVKAAEAESDPKKKQELIAVAKAKAPKYVVRTPTAIPGPLYASLNEEGLEQVNLLKASAYKSGRTSPASGKYPRFDESKPMQIPPVMTGEGLKTKRGEIRAGKPASFGTIGPLSVLIVNRFVIPFQLTALLLLAAIIGAVIIAKRRL